MATPSEDLQKAIYDFLLADTDISALVGNRVYDGVPKGNEPDFPFIVFGSSYFTDDDADEIEGLTERLTLHIWSRNQSRLRQCKALTWLVYHKLETATLSLQTHALVGGSVDVWIPAVEADPDGITAHGTVDVVAMIEVAGG